MNFRKIKNKEQLEKYIRKKLYNHTLGFPINRDGALSSRLAEIYLIEAYELGLKHAKNG